MSPWGVVGIRVMGIRDLLALFSQLLVSLSLFQNEKLENQEEGMDMTIKMSHERAFSVNRMVLYLDFCGSCMNLCTPVLKWHRTKTHKHCTNVSFLVLILYYSYLRKI